MPEFGADLRFGDQAVRADEAVEVGFDGEGEDPDLAVR